MTVIAWDGYTIASDRMASYGGVAKTSRKMRRLKDGTILAVNGSIAVGLMVMQWYADGADRDLWPTKIQDTDSWAQMIVCRPDGTVFWYDKHPYKIFLKDKFSAWGYGADIATGALAAGADAIRAVKIANKYSPEGCGMGVCFCHVRPRLSQCRSDLAKIVMGK